MSKKWLSLLMAGAMVASMAVPVMAEEETETEPDNTITGDSSADDAFVVWGWNDDIKTILDTVFAEAYPEEYSRIVFVNTGGSDYYQTKLDAVLEEGSSNELYPDLMGLEVDYVQKYTNSDWLLSITDIGMSEDDLANMYQYNVDLGKDYDGNVKALFWQATPGSFAVRADLAEAYLGTTDPDELAAYFTDIDTIIATAELVNEASGGTCKLFSGYDEIKRVLTNSRSEAFYDENDVITLDENITTYLEAAKTLYDEDLTYNISQWSADWYGVMDGDGTESNAALAYCGCPWFVYWCLSDTWLNNTILVESGIEFYWGGTGLAATTECSDTELAALIMSYLTTDTDAMVAINAQNADFVNNTAAIEAIVESGASADGNGYMYSEDQNFIEFYLDKVNNLDASTVTAEDQTILSLLDTTTQAYASGEIADIDTALSDLTAAIHDTYSYLSVE